MKIRRGILYLRLNTNVFKEHWVVMQAYQLSKIENATTTNAVRTAFAATHAATTTERTATMTLLTIRC